MIPIPSTFPVRLSPIDHLLILGSVQSSHGILNGSSIVNDNPSNDTDNLATNPNNLSNVEPPVTLSGCTVGDRDDFNTANSNTQLYNTRGKESEFVPQWYD